MPLNRSEPPKKYYPSPDFRPEAIAELDEKQRAILMQQYQLEQDGIPQTGRFDYDDEMIQNEKEKLNLFLNYRKQFEMSQQVRIQSKMQES